VDEQSPRLDVEPARLTVDDHVEPEPEANIPGDLQMDEKSAKNRRSNI